MRPINLKLYIFIIVLTTLFTIYLAILTAPAFVKDDLWQTIENLQTVTAAPFSLKTCSNTGKTLGTYLLIELLAIGYAITAVKNRRPGEEQGSARLKDPKGVCRKIADKDYLKNRILTENVRISVIGRKISLSLNTLILGGMGAGKSFFTLIPNILQGNTSFVINDPSKELARKTGWFLKHVLGYDVKVFDLEDPVSSAKYNFFRYIQSEDDMRKICDIIFEATEGEHNQKGAAREPMWENMAKDWLLALIALLWYRGRKDEQNIETLVWLLDEDPLVADEKGSRAKTVVMAMFDDLELRQPGNLATRAYKSATDGELVTIRGVKSTLRGRIGKFLLPSIQQLMSRDELELDQIGEIKTALFLAVPSEDTSFNFIVSMIYAQLFPILYRHARKQPDNKLPVPLQFFMDEMANFIMPKDFILYLTTSRKHAISYVMFFQETGQIEEKFGKEKAQTLIGTCNTVLYLGGSGHETNKKISEWIGNETVYAASYNRSYGRMEGFSRNDAPTKRELITADEIDTRLSDNQALLYVKGQGWMIDYKNNPLKHPNYKYTAGESEGSTFTWDGSEIARSTMMPVKTAWEKQEKADITINLDQFDMFAFESKYQIYVNEGE